MGQEQSRVCLHYLLNRLQPLPWEQPVLVSLNPVREPQARCVITLGSPFSGHVRASNAARAYELYSGRPLRDDDERAERLRTPPSVPTRPICSSTRPSAARSSSSPAMAPASTAGSSRSTESVP